MTAVPHRSGRDPHATAALLVALTKAASLDNEVPTRRMRAFTLLAASRQFRSTR